tara:strand:+ start:50 stop:238 length:189 start_codon:yes stop_codon:yes gene_type:complete
MPIKYKEDTVVKDRQTGKTKVQRFYIKNISTKELMKALEGRNTLPKHKQKIRNELTRRKVDY